MKKIKLFLPLQIGFQNKFYFLVINEMINFIFADDADVCPNDGTYCCSYIEELVRISIKKKRKICKCCKCKIAQFSKNKLYL